MTDNLDDLMGAGGLAALGQLLHGETARSAHQQAGILLGKYGKIKEELEALSAAIDVCSPRMSRLLMEAHERFDPNWRMFDLSKSDLEEFSLFKFMGTISNSLFAVIGNSGMRLHAMAAYSREVLPVFSTGKITLTSLAGAEEAAAKWLMTAHEEFEATVLGFDKVVGGIYLATRREYKKLRRKFLGESAKQEEKDSLEEQMMMSLFGVRPPEKDVALGPATALIDENCVLTQLLTDVSNALPKYYEKVVPLMHRGAVTSRTKTTKTLDEGEVEDYAGTLTTASHPTFVKYAQSPEELLAAVMRTLLEFYASYSEVAIALRELMSKADIGLARAKRELEHRMVDPRSIGRQYARINFLAIRPSAEDVAPRTRMERDFSVARSKLFAHLRETMLALSGMDRDVDSTEQYALKRVREAIELRATMDEVSKSDRQKTLSRNIRDDNEFYVSKAGNIGSLEVEREPAPKIKYEEVIGASFVEAKCHVEEVVKIASHPHVMRISAPRGDVKSNLLLIGPYGCGKTEIARAIMGDKRIIGFSLSTADLLTAYMHESVKNVKRMYDHAKDMRRQSRYTKPVGIALDEFDRFFSYGEGTHQAYDGPRMEGALQEMMDGVVGYEGVFMIALTNSPKTVPEAILRRFKYVDVVGQLNREERARLFKQFLNRGLPLVAGIGDAEYLKWSEILDHAPGDVIGKVADEVHFKFMREFIEQKSARASAVERALAKRLRNRESTPGDYSYVKKALASHRWVDEAEITTALDSIMKQPQVKMQINKAREVYRDAEEIMAGLSVIGDRGLGFGATVSKRSKLWSA